MANRWNEETTLKFVQLYRENENLWNIFISEYRNRDTRSASMQSIASELNIPNFTIKDVPKKIKSLRSTYYLELAKVEKSKASGGGASFVYKPLVPWKSEPKTIQDNDDTTSNLNNEEAVDDDLIDNSAPVSHVDQLANTLRSEKTTFNPPSRSKLRGKRRLETITDAVQDFKNLNRSMNPSTIAREDECDTMGKHTAFQLRELTEYDIVLAHYDIQKILVNYRLKT
ncbi:hypothetical protein ACI65C_013712 [Semiaphis heraclei]